jgi:hypothetical protein
VMQLSPAALRNSPRFYVDIRRLTADEHCLISTNIGSLR